MQRRRLAERLECLVAACRCYMSCLSLNNSFALRDCISYLVICEVVIVLKCDQIHECLIVASRIVTRRTARHFVFRYTRTCTSCRFGADLRFLFTCSSPARSPGVDTETMLMNNVYRDRFPKVSTTSRHAREISRSASVSRHRELVCRRPSRRWRSDCRRS